LQIAIIFVNNIFGSCKIGVKTITAGIFMSPFCYRHENDFSVGRAKIGEKNNQDNQIQNVTLCNMYFAKKNTEEFSRIFVLKVTVQSVRLLQLQLQQKIAGASKMCYLLPPPNNFVGGAAALPTPSSLRFSRLCQPSTVTNSQRIRSTTQPFIPL